MRRGIGELFLSDDDRSYFPLPVATDNDRNPIIPVQLGGRPMPAAAGALGDYLPETSLTVAVAQPAAEIGIGALAGFGALVVLVYLWTGAKAKGRAVRSRIHKATR